MCLFIYLCFWWYQISLSQAIELKLSVDSLEKERDFYFAKLRDIEILLQCPGIEMSPVIYNTSHFSHFSYLIDKF